METNPLVKEVHPKTRMGRVRNSLAPAYENALSAAVKFKSRTMAVVSDRVFQVTAATASGAAVACGMGGATVGLVGGGFLGGAVGLLPALFTFGLSIPVFTVVGGGMGAVGGAATCGTIGGISGGGAGYGVYTRRQKIAEVTKLLKAKALSASNTVRAKIYSVGIGAKSYFSSAQEKTLKTASATREKTVEIASNKTVQVTAASATGGAVAMGTAGGITGLATGGTIGAAIGLVPAIFTFGLSIPVGAAIGSGCGLVAGTAVGGTTGFVGGGAVGYGAFTRKEEIKTGLTVAKTKMIDGAGYVKDKGRTSVDYVRARIVGGTGGTSD